MNIAHFYGKVKVSDVPYLPENVYRSLFIVHSSNIMINGSGLDFLFKTR